MSLKSHQKKQIALSKVIKKNNSAKNRPFFGPIVTYLQKEKIDAFLNDKIEESFLTKNLIHSIKS